MALQGFPFGDIIPVRPACAPACPRYPKPNELEGERTGDQLALDRSIDRSISVKELAEADISPTRDGERSEIAEEQRFTSVNRVTSWSRAH